MTIGYVARRLVEAYGRDAARDKAVIQALVHSFAQDHTGRDCSVKVNFWRSVARACTRVPVPARRGATP
jgi:hypothetical protein